MTETINKQLPYPAPAPSPDLPAARPTVPVPKARPIPKKIRNALEAMLAGKAKNLIAAAKVAGISREYLSRTLSARPDIVTWVQARAARTLGIGASVAAAKMLELIFSNSSRTSFEASRHVLALSGLKPPADATVNVNVVQSVGYCIDLRGRTDRPAVRQESGAGVVITNAEDDSAAGVVIDAKPVE
jgi:hypothetical protein